jgi:hypothetical protein
MGLERGPFKSYLKVKVVALVFETEITAVGDLPL